jgi:nitrite reductase/ring-hydroxylating ferredoxin subunit
MVICEPRGSPRLGEGLLPKIREIITRGLKMSDLTKVAKVNEIPSGQAIMVERDGHRIALFNVNGNFYAIADTCTHQGGPLSEGTIEGFEVTCPWHGAKFDVRTGEVVGPPATKGVQRYAVKIEGSDIKVEIP